VSHQIPNRRPAISHAAPPSSEANVTPLFGEVIDDNCTLSGNGRQNIFKNLILEIGHRKLVRAARYHISALSVVRHNEFVNGRH